ncbi:MAG: phosphotransferase family protein [Actinobacteria bacterium]|nr:phosphotransferase family protein [Actinomycetota bacterium]
MATATLGAAASTVGPFLAAALDDSAWRSCTLEIIAGGKSNLTYLVTSPAGQVVLRRPPLHNVLPTAHDMVREHRVISALAATDVPVPCALLLCTDPAVLGAPFHVMSYVPGPVAKTSLPPGYAEQPVERAAIADSLVDVLARLHAVDIDAVGLSNFGRPQGYLARQVRRWVGQWEASRAAEMPALDGLAQDLAAAIPDGPAATVVHGDYRLDNVVLDPDRPGNISAVLDWEMSTIGDPLTDLGLLLVYWAESDDDDAAASYGAAVRGGPSVTVLPGFPTRSALTARYAELTGRDLSALPWYVSFACFKLAVVVAGIVVRHRAGAMVGGDFEGIEAALEPLVAHGHAALAAAR